MLNQDAQTVASCLNSKQKIGIDNFVKKLIKRKKCCQGMCSAHVFDVE